MFSLFYLLSIQYLIEPKMALVVRYTILCTTKNKYMLMLSVKP